MSCLYIFPRILTPFFTLLHLGIDVNGPQSQLLVLVNHPPWGLPVEFSIWLDADVPSPGSQHSGTADATHPRPRHHPFLVLLVSYFLRARYVMYYKERITMNGRLSATISAVLERSSTRLLFLLFSPSSRDTRARDYLILCLIFRKKKVSSTRIPPDFCEYDLATRRSFYRVDKSKNPFRGVCLENLDTLHRKMSHFKIYPHFL